MTAPRALLRPVFGHPGACLALFSGLGLLLAVGIGRLEVRTDGAALYPDESPVVERTRADRRAFHERDRVVALVTARGEGRLDSRSGLRYLKRLHESAQEVPGVAPLGVRSLATVLDPRPGEPLTAASGFLDEIPEDREAFETLRARAHDSRLVRGLFLSEDGRAAALYIPAAPEAERDAVVAELERWAGQAETGRYDVRLTGTATAETLLGRRVIEDLTWLVPAMVAVIGALLFLAVGSVGGAVVALAEVGLVLAATLGAMGWWGAPVTLVTTILPVVVMTVAVADEIHLLDRFRRRWEEEGDDGRRRALAAALEEVGRPIVLTSLTTSVAFLSFLSAPMGPVRDFGLFTAVGILLAMVLSFTLLPALILVLPRRWLASGRGVPAAGGIPWHERLLLSRPGAGLVATGLLLAGGLIGLGRLSVQDSWVENFDPDSELRAADRAYDEHFWGSHSLDVVVEGGEQLYFHTPVGLGLLEEVRRVAANGPHVGGVLSPLLAFERAGRAAGLDGPVSGAPPDSLARIAKLLHSVSRQTGLHRYLRFDGSSARVRAFVKGADYRRAGELERHLEARLPPLFRTSEAEYHLSGDLVVAREVVGAVVTNMLRSVGWTLFGVVVLLAVACRSLRAAVVRMVPLGVAVVVLLGGMGWAGVPLGIATSMFAAVTIGVGVDFSVHLSHGYARARREGSEPGPAVAAALEGPGRAIRWNALVLAAGLSVLALSGLRPNRSLGLLFAAAMATCYATTLSILPGLLRSGFAEVPEPDVGSTQGGEDERKPAEGCERSEH